MAPRPPIPLIGIVLSIVVSVTLVIGVVVVVIVPKLGEDKGAVKYLSVEAVPVERPLGSGHQLDVHIELETTADMPHVGAYVDVSAKCGPQGDETKAFFMKLSDLESGSVVKDRAELFLVPSLSTEPDRCDITLSLTGAKKLARYCYHRGVTSPGACT